MTGFHMTGTELAAVIGALGTLLGVVFSGIAALQAAKASKNSTQNSRSIEGVATKVEEVHVLTNSLTSRSNTAERAAGEAEGEIKGRAALTAELGAAALAREHKSPPSPGPSFRNCRNRQAIGAAMSIGLILLILVLVALLGGGYAFRGGSRYYGTGYWGGGGLGLVVLVLLILLLTGRL